MNNLDSRVVLVTGATGYVGGRLVPLLLDAGYRVRCLVRNPARLQGRPWIEQVEVVQANVLEPETLTAAMQGVYVAYYMIHSMDGSSDFHQQDLTAARNFGNVAKASGVQRIVYLGGLGDPDADLSQHLRSRQQTGEALSEAGVPVTEFRAAIIVGSGSVSFEMIRYLTERIPAMICPRWVFTRIQPISIRNVLEYLVSALETPESAGQIIEIGGADVLTYGQMMLGYAEVRGLRRLLLPVPLLTPNLSSYWVHWVTPIPAGIARPLIKGLRNEVIVRDDSARRIFPHIQPMNYKTAVERALARMNAGEVETTWSDALGTTQRDAASVVLTTQEGVIIERRQRLVKAPPATVYRAFTALGGNTGWLYANWAWRLRANIDRIIGGVGFRRGRRHATDLRVGDALDFWRVEAIVQDRLLRLRAEMKVPGNARLQFEAQPQSSEETLLAQTAYFVPKGLSGFLYWYLLYPFHVVLFSGLIRKLSERAEALYRSETQVVENHPLKERQTA